MMESVASDEYPPPSPAFPLQVSVTVIAEDGGRCQAFVLDSEAAGLIQMGCLNPRDGQLLDSIPGQASNTERRLALSGDADHGTNVIATNGNTTSNNNSVAKLPISPTAHRPIG